VSTEAETKRWIREERALILQEAQEDCDHKRSASLALGGGDKVVCDDCKKEITFDYACRRPAKT